MNNKDLFKIAGRGNYFPLTSSEIELIHPVEKLDKNNKKGILLVHGFTSTPAVYSTLIPYLTANYNIICPCLAGHASSLQSFAASTGADWFESVEQAYLKLKLCCDSVTVVGLSLGGVLSINLAHRYKFDRLLLLAPAFELYYPMRLLRVIASALSFVRDTIPAVGGNIKKQGSCEIAYKKIPLASVLNFIDYTQQIKQLGIPTQLPITVFLGRFDQVINVNKVAHYFIDKSNCEVQWLESSAHVLPLDNDLDIIVREIQQT